MKKPACLDRIARCALALLAAPVALRAGGSLVNLADRLPALSADQENAPNRFSVSGVVYMTGTPAALLTDAARGWSRFVWEKSPVEQYQIKEITHDHVVLVERASGKEVRLRVAAPTDGPAPFTKEWIRSRANPMHGQPMTPPRELYDDWPNATASDKAEIAGFYEKYGWKLVHAEMVAGAADFDWEPYNQAELNAAAEASREAFSALLTPEQHQVWQQILSHRPIYATKGKFMEEQQRLIAQYRRVHDTFQATLTAEQKAAFETMSMSGSVRPSQPADPEYSPPQPAPAVAGGPAPFTKAWINSKANPMLTIPDDSELTRHWAELDRAQRQHLVEYYQHHGWQLIYVESVSGNAGSMAWRNIYEAERQAVLKTRRDAFKASLAPEQLRIWSSGALGQTVFVADGKPDYTRNHNPLEEQKIFEMFWAGLTSKQRAAYPELSDFTKADWK